MRKQLLVLLFLIPLLSFGQILRMNAFYVPDKSTNFPINLPVYSLIYVGSNDTLYSVTSSYTTADDINQVIADGNYVAYPSGVAAGDTSYFDFASQRISTKTGVTSIESDSLFVYNGAKSIYTSLSHGGGLYKTSGNLTVKSEDNDIIISSGLGNGDYIQFRGGASTYGILNGKSGEGNWTFGNNTEADSVVDVHGGMEVDTDILVGGGWQTSVWVPTVVFAGGTPQAPDTVVAKYQVTNNRVNFYFDIKGTNDAGTTLTSVSLTPPVTIRDVDAYPAFSAAENGSAKTGAPSRVVIGLIDAESASNRKLYVATLSIANTNDYRITGSGFYEITGK